MRGPGPEHPGAAHLARRIVKGSAAIASFPDDPAEHPLVEVGRARNVSQTPVEVQDALLAKLREKFNDAQLVELTATLAWENYRARFDHAFSAEAEGFTEGSFCAMPVRAEDVESSRAWRGDSGKKVKSWK